MGKFKGTPKGVPLNKRDLKWFDKLLVGVDAGFLAPKKIIFFSSCTPPHGIFCWWGNFFGAPLDFHEVRGGFQVSTGWSRIFTIALPGLKTCDMGC